MKSLSLKHIFRGRGTARKVNYKIKWNIIFDGASPEIEGARKLRSEQEIWIALLSLTVK